MNLDSRGPYELRGLVRFFEPNQVVLVGHMPANDRLYTGNLRALNL